MMNVLLVVTDYHTSFDLMILKLLLKKHDLNVIVFATEKKASYFKGCGASFSFETAPSRQSNNPLSRLLYCREYLGAIYDVVRKHKIDLLFITTAQDAVLNFFLCNIVKKTPTLLVVHNIDRFVIKGDSNFRRKEQAFNSYSKWRKRINACLASSSKSLIVLTDYLQKEMSRIMPEKHVYELPFRVSSAAILRRRREEVLSNRATTFTISGSVNGVRRNYEDYFDLFDGSVKGDFRLQLLGEVQDSDIVSRGKRLLGDKLIAFDRFLTEEEYMNGLLSSHFLLADLSRSMPYGVFKASGVEFDGPSLGIPVITPFDVLKSSRHGIFVRYSEDKLLQVLNSSIDSVDQGTYEKEFLEPAIREASYFYEDKWAAILHNIIESSLA
jgi:hypothetical protein